MSLFQLDFNLIHPRTFVSSSYISDTSIDLDKNEILATCMDLFKSSSYWTISNLDITGSNIEALVVRPTSAPSGIDMRVLLTMNATASSNAWGNRADTIAETNNDRHLQIGICPHSASYTKGNYISDIPFGSDARWSRYWSCADYGTTITFQKMALIESQETFCILSLQNDGPHDAGYVGAIMVSFDSGSGEQDRRLYGMITVGDTGGYEAGMNSQSNFWPTHLANAFGNHAGVFIVSGGIANGAIGSNGNIDNIFEHLDRQNHIKQSVATSDTALGAQTMDRTQVFEPYMFHSDFPSARAMSMLRQVYMVNDEFSNLTTLVTSSDDGLAGLIGYVICASTRDAEEGMLFCSFKENQ